MEKYYKERFEARSRLDEKIVPLVKINQILQEMRDELRDSNSFRHGNTHSF
jgi:hypothetical protein